MECAEVEEPEESVSDCQNSTNVDNEKANIDTMDCSEEVEDKGTTVSGREEESGERKLIREAILEHLASNDRVFFKSLKENEDELDKQQKIDFAAEVLDRDYGLFLAKFGNHLLREHLCYFENRREEDSLIVDIYLKQLIRAFAKQTKNRSDEETKPKAPAGEEMVAATELSPAERCTQDLRDRLLDHLSSSEEAHFRSQQVGEPDLNREEKRAIAEAVLGRSASLFLARFGTHLLEEHLTYFDKRPCADSYEVDHHLKRLRKTHCKQVSEVGIKNRRFEALKKMVEGGSYFCESEMRNRNPLLYEQLVGKFLTAEEKRERLDVIDTTNITFVNLLLEQIDREAVKKLRKEQEEEEEDDVEEEELSDDRMEDDSEEDNDLDKSLWGEEYTDGSAPGDKKTLTKKEENRVQEKKAEEDVPELSDAEKKLLLEEFRSNMYQSFLRGKDTNFDYSQVDYNSDYDDLEVQGQDEEEKYFDEESSQEASCGRMSDGEDVLDQYMAELKPEPTPHQLADRLDRLTHTET